MVGLLGFGLAVALMIRSELGLGPWDAFHVGLHNLTGITVGTASILAGMVIVGGSLLVGVRPGPGTLVNMVMIGVFMDLLLPHVPAAPSWAWGGAYYAVALVLAGVSTGLYIAPRLGAGPRDGLVVGLSQRTGWPVRRVRTLVEVGVLGAGWAMGGAVGIGTVIFSLSIGPSMQWGMQMFGLIAPPAADVPRRGLFAAVLARRQRRAA